MPSHQNPPFSIRALHVHDLAALTPILRQHIHDLHSGEVVETEVQAVLAYMTGALDASGRPRQYLVACDASGQVQACMAWATPDALMTQHFVAAGVNMTATVELLNAFVATDYLGGKGVGRLLFGAVCHHAAAAGAHRLVVNSGLRYRHSWGFYDRVCDSSHGLIANYYGAGRDAKTWFKAFEVAEVTDAAAGRQAIMLPDGCRG